MPITVNDCFYPNQANRLFLLGDLIIRPHSVKGDRISYSDADFFRDTDDKFVCRILLPRANQPTPLPHISDGSRGIVTFISRLPSPSWTLLQVTSLRCNSIVINEPYRPEIIDDLLIQWRSAIPRYRVVARQQNDPAHLAFRNDSAHLAFREVFHNTQLTGLVCMTPIFDGNGVIGIRTSRIIK